jgi:hypothetical protein
VPKGSDDGASRGLEDAVAPRPGLSESSTWTVAHRGWLAAQQFDETAPELVFADLVASVDGLSARKAAIAERLSRLAEDEQWWLWALGEN